MGYRRDCKLREISKAKIKETRNAIVNEMIGYDGEHKGFLIVQQIEFREDDEVTRMYLKGGMKVSSLDNLKNLRDALTKAINKVEKRNKPKNEAKPKESKPDVPVEVFDDPEEGGVCEGCKVNYPESEESEPEETWDEDSEENMDEAEDEGNEDVGQEDQEEYEESESPEENENDEEETEERAEEGNADAESDADLESDDSEWDYEDEYEPEDEGSEEVDDEEEEEETEDSDDSDPEDYDLGDEEEWEA